MACAIYCKLPPVPATAAAFFGFLRVWQVFVGVADAGG
jgi:hypothetical protein